MKEIDELKIFITLLSALASYIILIKDNKEISEELKIKYYSIFLIRMLVLFRSIKDDWPIEKCSTINIIITIIPAIFDKKVQHK